MQPTGCPAMLLGEQHHVKPAFAKRASLVAILCLAVLSVGPTRPGFSSTTATVRLLDGRIVEGRIEGARFDDPNLGRTRIWTGGKSVEFRADHIWQIELPAATLPRGSRERIWLADGSRLCGRLRKIERSRNVVAMTDLFGLLEIRREALAGLGRFDEPVARPPTAAGDLDVLWTALGDRLEGRLLSVGPRAFLFRSQLGRWTYGRSAVRALALAGTQKKAPAPPYWVLFFPNGDRVVTVRWSVEDDGRTECLVAGQRKATPVPPARAVRLGSCLDMFSRIRPRRFLMRPILAGTKTIIVDGAPGNRALRAGERQYLFGLFLRPRCEMDYDLAGEAKLLLAELGPASEAGSAGQARVAFTVDGKPADEFLVSADRPPVAIAVNLAGAKALRITVEPADYWACGAHAVLGEPVLVKKRAEPR